MARRRRGASVKTGRQTRKVKKNEKVNGLLSPTADTLQDDSSQMESDSGAGPAESSASCVGSGAGSGAAAGTTNCFDGSAAGSAVEPVVHHKKFGKIRVSGQNENSLDVETTSSSSAVADSGKDYGRFDSKSSDETESEPMETNTARYTNDVGVLDIMRGIEITGPKAQNSYVDFRKQSSVYKVENDIPLDGSVIIKPGTFSSNTITSSVKPNLFFDASAPSEINSVNFLKVLQGIEMLERNVGGSSAVSMEFDESLSSSSSKQQQQQQQQDDKSFLANASPAPAPAYMTDETDCKPVYADDDRTRLKPVDGDDDATMKSVDDIKTEEPDEQESGGVAPGGKTVGDVSSPDDTSSDLQTETDEATRKLQGVVLADEARETSGSPASKASDEVPVEKKPAGNRSRTGSTDTVGSEGSSSCGTTIRRSNRIRSIGIMKQKEREQAAVRSETVIKSPLPPGSPAVTPPVPGYDDKPVKVKSRWRRSSELEMHGTGKPDPDSASSNCPSPVNLSQQQSAVPAEPTPEDLERLEREKKEIEEGLRSFTILTENEYKMERSACKESKRMVCDCVLTKEEISRGEEGCGEDCLNRMLFLECGSRCALGDRCTNKRFQKLQYANCKIFKTEKKGFGLRAEEDLVGNTFIMEYVGEVVDQREFSRRVKMYAKENNKHFYFMALKGDSIIDATNKGNISRFINHSCDPNAETQKWTINGELRVGFFTRRFVAAGEEITFDYQFQRYGKQAQKCYCEAPNCRGWIGENPDDSDEEEEDDDDEEEDEDEEEEEEVVEDQDETKKEAKKVGKTDGDRERKEEPAKPLQPVGRVRKKAKKRVERKKERKGTTIVDDMGLDEEIQKLFQTGLKNRAHTLTLSRLMVRAEDWSTRGKLLKLIREGETPCRRLFLDYHGLRLICSWMLSRELDESSDKNERRLEILKTLSKLPIPNKNMLLDSKVLSVVEQWSKSGCVVRKLSVDEEAANEEKKPKVEEMIPGLGGEIDETISPPPPPTSTSSSSSSSQQQQQPQQQQPPRPDTDKGAAESGKSDEGGEAWEKVKRLAEVVLESWSALKEVFKIPKKERIEQMKEHERQADRGYSEYLDNKENVRDKYDRHDRYGRSDRYRDRDRDRLRDRKRVRESPPDPEWFRNHERNSKMTKHERRQLFALKVLQEDEEAKKRSEHLEMWKQHESRCLALGLDPNLNAACDPQTGFPIFFDHGTGTWQNCPPSSGPSPSMPHSVTPTMCPSPMYSVNPSMMHNCPMCPNMSVCSNMNNSMCHNGMMPNNIPIANGPVCPNVPVPPCQGQPYANMTPQYPGPLPTSNFDGLDGPYHEAVPSDDLHQAPYEESAANEFNRPVITEVPLNVPIKLPPKWKTAKDPKGRVYYYHVKERVSQWEPPQWSEEDAKIEAARTVDLEMGDSSSSTESSSDTSSEDEEDDAENAEDDSEGKRADNPEATNNGDATEAKVENSVEKAEDGAADGTDTSPNYEPHPQPFDDEKDDELSAWEDEDDPVKSVKSGKEKTAAAAASGDATAKPSTTTTTTTTTGTEVKPAKIRRAGLVQEIMISPRREEDRVDNRKYKEVKEMLRRQKEEVRMKEKLRMKGDKGANLRLSRSKKKRKEKIGRSNRLKVDKVSSLTAESSTDKKIKENFKNNMAGAIVSHLNPYRKQDCKIGRITCNEDFKHLARKLTHFVMLKELKHCRGVDDLECNDSVKAKAKDFIKKYMAKFGAVYQRPQHEVWKT